MSDDISSLSKKTDAGKNKSVNNDVVAKRKSNKPLKEIGGRDGPDPTRYGDWEKAGRCIDF
jgi:hypothetical protein